MPGFSPVSLLPHLEPWQWGLLLFAAFCTGLSKTGVAGVGVVSVGIFPLVLSDPRAAVGSVLLLLIGADVVAVSSYRRDAEWRYLWKLFPWTAVGVLLGYLAMGRIAAEDVRRLIGGMLLLLVLFMVPQRLRKQAEERRRATGDAPAVADDAPSPSPFVSATTGVLAGFTTMVANAAGPIMTLYLLAMRLPKVAFIGTAAWFFFLINLFKVPFGIALGTVTPSSAVLALVIFPGALFGGLLGRKVLHALPQTAFEWIAIGFTALAGLKLLL